MIQLIRVYRDGLVIHAESYDRNERPVEHRHPLERCRCIPEPIWRVREYELRQQFKQDKVTVTTIYPTPSKRTI
jgi:hypothetical protein